MARDFRDALARGSLLLALLVAAAPALAATGPPDRFGYTWADDQEPGVDATLPAATAGPFSVPLGKDKVSAPIPFGFNFPFYGASYPSFVLSSNGWISFDTTLTNSFPSPLPIPLPGNPNALVAWYWRGLDAPLAVRYSTFPAGLFVSIQTKTPVSTEYDTSVFVVFYRSGVIKVVWQAAGNPAAISVGIENAAGDDGQNPWLFGSGQNGFAIRDGKAVVFLPPPKLDCTAPTPITCGQTLSAATAGVSRVGDYLCSPDPHAGPERVFRFTNPGLNDVKFSLGGVPAGVDLDVFFLADRTPCSEFACIEGGADTVERPFLPPGTYEVVVDGKAATDLGAFSLTATCTPKLATISCGTPVRGATSGLSAWSAYSVSPFYEFGPEMLYQFTLPKPGNYTVRLTPDPGTDSDLLLFGPGAFDPPDGARQWGDSRLALYNPPVGTYFFLVDGRVSAGGFTIQVDCDIFLLDCSAPAGTLQCFQETSGSTAGATNQASLYSCTPDVLDGPEVVLRFHNDVKRTVTFAFQGDPGLELLLVPGSCDERSCSAVSQGGRLVAHDLDPGDYVLAVDGKNGARGAYRVTPYCASAVDPKAGTWAIDAGKTVHETKTAWVAGDLVRGDVLFAVDTTSSMGPSLANLQQTANAVIDQLNALLGDVDFGLASFEDYPKSYDACGYAETYGGTTDRPWRLDLSITGDRTALAGAIGALALRAGGDSPEAYLRVLHEAVADANIAWRPGARRFLVVIGDDEPHACDAMACARARAGTGVDPGPDAVTGTADDLDLAAVLAEVKASGIEPLFLFPGNTQKPFLLQDWGCWMGQAGGRAYDAPAGTLPPALVGDVQSGIESTTIKCDKLEVRASPGYETWVKNLAPLSRSVTLPARATFDLDLGPPPGTPSGTYSFTVDIVCDGVVVAAQAVTITVSGSCSPKPPADAGPDRSVCPGGTVVLGTAAVPGLTYAWAPATELDDATRAQPTFTASPALGTRTYTLTVTDPATGCTATAAVRVDVVNAAPAGRIGNALHAVKRTADVLLDWASGPLAPPVYNVHRFAAKTDILAAPAPPVIGPIGFTSSSETYTHMGGVGSGGVAYYQVYGRDCAGASINN